MSQKVEKFLLILTLSAMFLTFLGFILLGLSGYDTYIFVLIISSLLLVIFGIITFGVLSHE